MLPRRARKKKNYLAMHLGTVENCEADAEFECTDAEAEEGEVEEENGSDDENLEEPDLDEEMDDVQDDVADSGLSVKRYGLTNVTVPHRGSVQDSTPVRPVTTRGHQPRKLDLKVQAVTRDHGRSTKDELPTIKPVKKRPRPVREDEDQENGRPDHCKFCTSICATKNGFILFQLYKPIFWLYSVFIYNCRWQDTGM